MLRAFGYRVTTCCDMLGVVGSSLKLVKFFMQYLWMLHDVVVVWQRSCNNVAPGHEHQFDFQLTTCRNTLHQGGQRRVTCCAQLTVLRSVAFKCCDRLAGAGKSWANNVGMCGVEMLLSFGRGFRFLNYRLASFSQLSKYTRHYATGRNRQVTILTAGALAKLN